MAISELFAGFNLINTGIVNCQIMCQNARKMHHSKAKQEGWLSPTERASVSAISLRHNLATSGVVPVCRCLHPFCGWRHLATSRESKVHLASPGYAPGTIAVNVA